MKSLRRTSLAVVSVLAMSWVLGAEVDESASELTLPQLQQAGMVSLADYRGKIVYLDFWASWCPPCLLSMPIMNDLRNTLQARGVPFEVVAVNVDSDPEDGIDFLLDNPVDFIVLSDPAGQTPARYAIKGMPTSFLVDADGRLVMKHTGFKGSDGQMIKKTILELAEAMQ